MLEPELQPITIMKTLRFKNPANHYVETIQGPALGTLLAGPLYIGLQGAWGPAVGYFLLTFLTGGLFWLILPFLATGIFRKHYLGMGWTELEPEPKKPKAERFRRPAMKWSLPTANGDELLAPVMMAMGICTVALLACMAWMQWGI